MDTDEMLNDDFLASLLRKMPLESPSDGFINKVMTGLEPLPSTITHKRTFFEWLKSLIPYLGVGLIIALILYSSDIPNLNFIYGKEYFSGMLVKAFHPFWISMKVLLSSRLITYFLLISVSAGFLFIIDKLFSRRFAL